MSHPAIYRDHLRKTKTELVDELKQDFINANSKMEERNNSCKLIHDNIKFLLEKQKDLDEITYKMFRKKYDLIMLEWKKKC